MEVLEQRIAQVVRAGMADADPLARVTVERRDDGKLDTTVISSAFAGMDSGEREAAFWPVFRQVPREDLVRMTYCLLLTPEEAERYFAEAGAP